jgi:hypothetical protein
VNNAVEPWMHLCLCILYISEFYPTEASTLLIEVANSHFHLYGCGYHHNCIDGAHLDTGTDDEDDSVAHYMEYYD